MTAYRSAEDAWAQFLDGAHEPLRPLRAFEDKCCFYAGLIAGMELVRAGLTEAATRDIQQFHAYALKRTQT